MQITFLKQRQTLLISFLQQYLWKRTTNYANYFSKKVSLERKDKLCKILSKSTILKSKDKLCKLLFKQNIFRKAKTNYANYFSWPLTLFKEFSNFFQEVKGSKYQNENWPPQRLWKQFPNNGLVDYVTSLNICNKS